MKIRTIIAGMGAVTVYGFSAVIAWDTFEREEKAHAETASKLEAVKSEKLEAQTERDNLKKKMNDFRTSADLVKWACDESLASKNEELEISRNLVNVLQAQIKAINSLPATSRILATPPVAQVPRVSAPIVTDVTIQAPPWIPPHRHMMAKLIKERAVKEWKDDYRMVEHEIGTQTKALDQLVELNRFAGNRDLLAKAAKSWKDDYQMMLHEFETQAEAKKRLGR